MHANANETNDIVRCRRNDPMYRIDNGLIRGKTIMLRCRCIIHSISITRTHFEPAICRHLIASRNQSIAVEMFYSIRWKYAGKTSISVQLDDFSGSKLSAMLFASIGESVLARQMSRSVLPMHLCGSWLAFRLQCCCVHQINSN